MSSEALRTKLSSFIVNSLKQSRASFQIKKEKPNKKYYDFIGRSHMAHLIKNITTLLEKKCSANDC